MKTVKIKELSQKNFRIYGSFCNMINPDWQKLGEEPCEFYRDMNILNLGNSTNAAFSVSRVCDRPKIIDNLEFHRTTGEAILPLDGDIIMQVAPASQGTEPPLDSVEAFYVQKGTLVTLNRGVWHGGSFADNTKCVNILIVLPERIYSDDCYIVQIPPENHIELAE